MNAVVQHETAGLPQQQITPMHMLQLAVQQGADLQKLEKLMELQERWEANQARKAFDAAISAAKAEIKPIVKKREVDFPAKNGGTRTNYKYEDLAAIADAIDPILAKHGLSYRHRSKQDGKVLTVTCVLSHRDGHFEETSLFAGNDESGNKNAIQSIGSAATYLQRYTLKLALGLAATKDDDGRIAGAEEETYLSNDQLNELERLLTLTKSNRAAFLKMCKVDSLEDLPARKFDEAKRRLEEKQGAS